MVSATAAPARLLSDGAARPGPPPPRGAATSGPAPGHAVVLATGTRHRIVRHEYRRLPLTESDTRSYVAMAMAFVSALGAFVSIHNLGIRPPDD
jgi:hypothetical protein